MTVEPASEGPPAGRFAFGRNWSAFLVHLGPARIKQATRSLQNLLERESLDGLRFLDIGSGSGLFSLAASILGAHVVSFDVDADSVECTRRVRDRYRKDEPDSSDWVVLEGSVLDPVFMASLGTFDVVYAWGVLHHTGAMNDAIDLSAERVAENGRFAVALYNDQGARSNRWRMVKVFYNRLPSGLRPAFVALVALPHEVKWQVVRGVNRMLTRRLARAENARSADRGMAWWTDWVDWVGGLPFEVARPDDILARLRGKGFALDRLVTCLGGHGCNEYVFRRIGLQT
jgi:2-polyprenyl-6-hydroxyphenyl methylase/3-demethylubiquinone-9 3-methyltransferase